MINFFFRFRYLFILFFFLIVIAVAMYRPINQDEPYYNICSNLVSEGKLPYLDFFYQHMPLVVYFYAVNFADGLASLIAGKIISVLLFFITGVVISEFLRNIKIKNSYILLFLLLYFFNSFILDWLTIIRVYSISTMLFVLALLSFYKICVDDIRAFNLFITGFLFSLTSLSKIVFAGNLFLFVLLLILFYRKSFTFKSVIYLITGILVPYIVFFVVFRNDLPAIYQNVVLANMMIKENLQPEFFPNLYKPFLYLLLPQNLMIIIMLLFSGKEYSRFELFILLNIVLYFFLHFFTLLQIEYYVSITPPLILLFILRIDKIILRFNILLAKLENFKINPSKAFVLIYILAFPFGVVHLRYYIENKDIMPNVIQLNRIINGLNTIEGKKVLTSWEGYTIYSNKETLLKDKYFSNFFDINTPVEMKDKFKLIFPKEYNRIVIEKIPDIIVYDHHDPSHLAGSLESIITYYDKKLSYDFVSIYQKKKY